MPVTVPSRPLGRSTNFMVPFFSVTNSVWVPGAKAAAQGSSNVPTGVTLNGGTLCAALSAGWADPQLAKARAAGIRMAARIVLRMLSGTPSSDFCANLGGEFCVGVDEAGRGPL